MTPAEKARMVLVLSLFFFSLFAASSVLLLLAPIKLLNHNIYRAACRIGEAAASLTMVLLSYHFIPFRLVLTGDHHMIPDNKRLRFLIMSNHQTYVDWWYLFCFAWLKGGNGDMRFLAMDYIKYVPFLGWICYLLEFIFLKQKWILDQGPVAKQINAIKKSRQPFWLLIFPEGTLNTPMNRANSEKYAKKIGLSYHPRHVILPKSTGTRFLVEKLSPQVNSLVDITMGYSGIDASHIPYDEYLVENVFGRLKYPKEVHLHFRVFDTSKIPSIQLMRDTTQLSSTEKDGIKVPDPEIEEKCRVMFDEWLRSRFMEKDALLESFYLNGRFVPEILKAPVAYDQTAQIHQNLVGQKHSVAANIDQHIVDTTDTMSLISEKKSTDLDHRVIVNVVPQLADYVIVGSLWYSFIYIVIPVYLKLFAIIYGFIF